MHRSMIIMDAPPAYSESNRIFPNNGCWQPTSYCPPPSHNHTMSHFAQSQLSSRAPTYSPAPSYHHVDHQNQQRMNTQAKASGRPESARNPYESRILHDSMLSRAASDTFSSKKAGQQGQQRSVKPLHGPRSPPAPQYTTPGIVTNGSRPILHRLHTTANHVSSLDSPLVHDTLSSENNIAWDADRVNLLAPPSPSQDAIDWDSVEKTMMQSAVLARRRHDPSASFLSVSDEEDED